MDGKSAESFRVPPSFAPGIRCLTAYECRQPTPSLPRTSESVRSRGEFWRACPLLAGVLGCILACTADEPASDLPIAPPLAPITPSQRPDRFARIKQIVEITQGCLAIGALLCGLWWFLFQQPFSPTVKAAIELTQRASGDKIEVDAFSTFENVGKTSITIHCYSVAMFRFKLGEPVPDDFGPPKCQASPIVIKPSEVYESGDVEEFEPQGREAYIVASVIGDAQDGKWTDIKGTTRRIVLVTTSETCRGAGAFHLLRTI
jgi:hypothetical protein